MAPAARAAKPAETETVGTAIEQDLAEQNTEALAAAEPVADPRESALAALLSGEADPVIPADVEPIVDDSVVLDFGGNTKAVVLFSRYNQFVDGLFTRARKGDVIKTDAASLKRGVRIGALKKLGE